MTFLWQHLCLLVRTARMADTIPSFFGIKFSNLGKKTWFCLFRYDNNIHACLWRGNKKTFIFFANLVFEFSFLFSPSASSSILFFSEPEAFFISELPRSESVFILQVVQSKFCNFSNCSFHIEGPPCCFPLSSLAFRHLDQTKRQLLVQEREESFLLPTVFFPFSSSEV